tara:strand:+ start:11543 stop:13030 length:1488 start_codon:yes stop_codon:yes gene_type:complete
MTVIRPNSISGITSITGQGGDINVYRADGTAGDLIINNITGAAATFTGVLSYEDVTNVDSVGVITARAGINVTGGDFNLGSTIKLGNASGIITATTFTGNLTGTASTSTNAATAYSIDSAASLNTSGIVTAKSFVPTTGQLSNRNLIINGDQKICQRGNQNASTAQANYVTDRFAIYENGGTAYHGMHQDSGTDLPEFPKCLRADCTTASSYTGSHEAKITYQFEGQDVQHFNYGTASNQKVTLSFYVRSNQAATFAIWFYRSTGNRQNGKTYTINSANTWEKKTVTINGDASNAIPNDSSGDRFTVQWILYTGPSYSSGTNPDGTWETRVDANRYAGHTATIGANTNDYFDITGVQLEVGDTATPFEHRNTGEELLRCQRYCMKWWNHGDSTNNHSRFPPGYYQNSTSGVFFLFHSVPMRKTDGRTFNHNIGVIENMTGGGNGNNLAIMSDGCSNMITPIILSGMSGVSQHSIFVPRIGSAQTDWYLIVASEIG